MSQPKSAVSLATDKFYYLRKLIQISLIIILIYTTCIFSYAIVSDHVKGEAYMGNFTTYSLNEGWTLFDTDTQNNHTIDLPYSLTHEQAGNRVLLSHELPSSIEDGMTLITRASMQDIIIRIDGEERGSYTTSGFDSMNDKLPSSFVAIDLTKEDASKIITIDITPKKSGVGRYTTVTYGFGANVWFPIIQENIPIFFMALLVILVGSGAFLIYLLLVKNGNNARSLAYISTLMIVIGMWMLSESQLRQIFFGAPSYSGIYSYILLGSIAGLAELFFNGVQNRRYQKLHYTVIACVVAQLAINICLNQTGVMEYYDTLPFCHFWSIVAILVATFTIILDIRKKYIKEYRLIAIGCAGLVLCGSIEIISFYLSSSYKLGTYLGIGLVILLIATMAQTFIDAVTNVEKRRLEAEKRNQTTIHTITKAIDAKDEYTGGHSERVGTYARILCEDVADQYHFTTKDFANIEYIGNLHDIGKIGVPDSVLKKNGTLNPEEYELMKSHTTIGSSVLENVDTVYGLIDGVRHHHERFDGKGYPDGLKGEEISVYARILCLADSYDAMTSDRIYRKRLSNEEVREEIVRCAGTQFDPNLANAFLKLIDKGVIYPRVSPIIDNDPSESN